MNQLAPIRTSHSACPHDCPSTCALDVEILSPTTIGRVRGATGNSYTAGVICAKVARYAERIHSPDRLLKPLQRVGAKGGGDWREIAWDDALDLVAERFAEAERRFGSESVWPYHYAGTMGLVQRDGIHRLRHAKRYSNQFDSICTNMAWTGWFVGAGRMTGVDPREMAKSDCVVIWGTNAVATQVNVMTHAVEARRTRGAKIVAVDIYDNATMAQADLALKLQPTSRIRCRQMRRRAVFGHRASQYPCVSRRRSGGRLRDTVEARMGDLRDGRPRLPCTVGSGSRGKTVRRGETFRR